MKIKLVGTSSGNNIEPGVTAESEPIKLIHDSVEVSEIVNVINETGSNNDTALATVSAILGISGTLVGLEHQVYENLTEWNERAFTESELPVIGVLVDGRNQSEIDNGDPIHSSYKLSHWHDGAEERHNLDPDRYTPSEMKSLIESISDTNFVSDADLSRIHLLGDNTKQDIVNLQNQAASNSTALVNNSAAISSNNNRISVLEQSGGGSGGRVDRGRSYGQDLFYWDGAFNFVPIEFQNGSALSGAGSVSIGMSNATADWYSNYVFDVLNTTYSLGTPQANYAKMTLPSIVGKNQTLFLKVRSYDTWTAAQVHLIDPDTGIADKLIGCQTNHRKGGGNASSVFNGPNTSCVRQLRFDWVTFQITAEDADKYVVNGEINIAISRWAQSGNSHLHISGVALLENINGFSEVGALPVWWGASKGGDGTELSWGGDNSQNGMSYIVVYGHKKLPVRIPIVDPDRDLVFGFCMPESRMESYVVEIDNQQFRADYSMKTKHDSIINSCREVISCSAVIPSSVIKDNMYNYHGQNVVNFKVFSNNYYSHTAMFGFFTEFY